MSSTRPIARKTLLITLFVVIVGALAMFAGTASAAEEPYSGNPPPKTPEILPDVDVRGNKVTRPEPLPPVIGPDRVVQPRAQQLPFTGADLVLYLGTGIAAVATGTTLVRATRSRKTPGDAEAEE